MALGFDANCSNFLDCALAIVVAQKSSVAHLSPLLLFPHAGYFLLSSIPYSPSALLCSLGVWPIKTASAAPLLLEEEMGLGEEWGQGFLLAPSLLDHCGLTVFTALLRRPSPSRILINLLLMAYRWQWLPTVTSRGVLNCLLPLNPAHTLIQSYFVYFVSLNYQFKCSITLLPGPWMMPLLPANAPSPALQTMTVV